MKKFYAAIVTLLFIGTTLFAQEGNGPAMLQGITATGFFTTGGDVMKSVDGGDITTGTENYMGIGGFALDAAGTGINFKSFVLNPFAQGSLPGQESLSGSGLLLSQTYDLHVTLFEQKLYSAIGIFDDTTFVHQGSISGQHAVTEGMGKTQDVAFLSKIKPMDGLTVGVLYPFTDKASPILDGDGNSLGFYSAYEVSDAFAATEISVGYMVDSIGTINGGYKGLDESIFVNFDLAPGLVANLKANVGVNYDFTEDATATTIGLDATYNFGTFSLTNEDILTLSDDDPLYTIMVRGDYFLQSNKARLDVKYESGTDTLEIYPQFIMGAKVIPFAELNAGFKYNINNDDSTQSYWSIPLTITMLIL